MQVVCAQAVSHTSFYLFDFFDFDVWLLYTINLLFLNLDSFTQQNALLIVIKNWHELFEYNINTHQTPTINISKINLLCYK